jgi:hypothetical protein
MNQLVTLSESDLPKPQEDDLIDQVLDAVAAGVGPEDALVRAGRSTACVVSKSVVKKDAPEANRMNDEVVEVSLAQVVAARIRVDRDTARGRIPAPEMVKLAEIAIHRVSNLAAGIVTKIAPAQGGASITSTFCIRTTTCSTT